MNIVAGTQKETILNSFLKELDFGKIHRTLDFSEQGILAEASAKEFSENMKFTFTPWSFSGTEVEEQSGQVLFKGNGFDGRPLLGIIQSNSKTEKSRAVFAYSACITQAVKEKFELPTNGAGGILYGEENGKVRLLFLPPNIFEFSAHNAPETDYQKMQGVWQDKTFLSKNKEDASNARALFFTRAVLIYSALSGEFPFPKENLEERQADILDSNYLPLKNKVNGVNEILSDTVSFDLERASKGTEKEGIKRTDDSMRNFCFEELAAELGLSKDGRVKDAERKAKMSDEEFKAAAKRLMNKKNTQANTSRALRRYTSRFIVGVLLLIGIFIARHSINKNIMSEQTTISLTARQSAELFFTGMHNIDTIIMQNSSTGKSPRQLTDSISAMHVASKMRSAYSTTNKDTYTPEFWLYKPVLKDRCQFGITNFMLGESESTLTPANNRMVGVARKDKPVPQNETNNSKKTFAVFFYRVHSEGPGTQITVEKFTGTVELTFKKDRWLVTDASIASNEEYFSLEEFEEDRAAAFEEAQDDAILAADILRKKYYWIPTEEAMHNARIEDEALAQKYAYPGF